MTLTCESSNYKIWKFVSDTHILEEIVYLHIACLSIYLSIIMAFFCIEWSTQFRSFYPMHHKIIDHGLFRELHKSY